MSTATGDAVLTRRLTMSFESESITFDPGSFRDRSSRVFMNRGEVYRALDRDSRDLWGTVSAQPFYQRMSEAGKIVKSHVISTEEFRAFQLPAEFVAALWHEKIPFVSYPYEWSFEMLRDAALLQLNLLQESVRCGTILKDASPYNVQFRNAQPVFIDLGSFTRLNPGEPWSAYRQFCEMMLFPLMLQAYRGIDFHLLIRSQLEGITSRQFVQMMRLWDYFKPGVFVHGWLQALLERKTEGIASSAVNDLQSSGFDSSLIETMLSKLTRLIERLKWTPPQTQWTQYDDTLPHVAEDLATKSNFVKRICESQPRQLIWDLGCNDGRYSQIAAPFATTVVAMDQDHGCIDQLYKSLKNDRRNILPLCISLANPSPGLGWRCSERKRLEDRGRPDLVLCLGLIHHLVIGSNIPLPSVVEWLASLGGEVVLEFPTKNDAMVKSLLRNKRDQYTDYSLENLEWEMDKHFFIRRKAPLPSGERTLFHAVPKSLG